MTHRLRRLFSPGGSSRAVQTGKKSHPFSHWMGYVPLASPDFRLYDALREGIPIVDAALDKIVRLTGGFQVVCSQKSEQKALEDFVKNVPVGPTSVSLRQFISGYLDSLLTYGNAVGELVLDPSGREIIGLYQARLSDIHLKAGKNPLEVQICTEISPGVIAPVPHPKRILFTPLNPSPGALRGHSLLRSLPFVSSILMDILHATQNNFQRMGNLRYAVTYNPKGSAIDRGHAKEIADGMAEQWAQVMQGDNGSITDFVAVGDVAVKVIGADNQLIETQVPVQQMLEQIVAKMGIPPFMLGLHWSTTERMSTQQADILTSELASYRHLLEHVIVTICETFLRLSGSGAEVSVVWDNINLQDQLEEANVRLLNAQAALLEQQLGGLNEADISEQNL